MLNSYQLSPEGVTLQVYVVPGAAKSGFAGLFDGKLKLKIRSRAVEGQANTELRRFIAEYFAISKSCVSIKQGQTNRYKVLFIQGNPTVLSPKIDALLNADPEI